MFIDELINLLNETAPLFGRRKVKNLLDNPISACLRSSRALNIIDRTSCPLEGRLFNVYIKSTDDVFDVVKKKIIDEAMHLLFSKNTRDILDGKPVFHRLHQLSVGSNVFFSNNSVKKIDNDPESLERSLLSVKNVPKFEYEHGTLHLNGFIASNDRQVLPNTYLTIFKHDLCPSDTIVAYCKESPSIMIFYDTDMPIRNIDATVDADMVFGVQLLLNPWYNFHAIRCRGE